MNLSQLYYFRKLAELEHYTKAAKELYITQPSLSDAIASLEDELGIPLFKKEGRNIKLTKYGKEFYYYVCASLNELETGIALAKEKSGALGGSVDLGCLPTILGDFMPQAMNRYTTSRNARVTFNIHPCFTLDIVAGINAGPSDLGFCSFV